MHSMAAKEIKETTLIKPNSLYNYGTQTADSLSTNLCEDADFFLTDSASIDSRPTQLRIQYVILLTLFSEVKAMFQRNTLPPPPLWWEEQIPLTNIFST